MASYEERIEQHQIQVKAYLARYFNVRIDAVQDIGETSIYPYYAICKNHRETFGVMEAPSKMFTASPVVELSQEFECIDNLFHQRIRIAAGQCPECGNVLMAEIR